MSEISTFLYSNGKSECLWLLPQKLAHNYWNLPADARLRDVVIAVHADEANHRDVNHGFANELRERL